MHRVMPTTTMGSPERSAFLVSLKVLINANDFFSRETTRTRDH